MKDLADRIAALDKFDREAHGDLAALLAKVESDDVLADDDDGIGVQMEGPWRASLKTTIGRQLSPKQFPAWLAQQHVTREVTRLVLHETRTSCPWKGEQSVRDCWLWHTQARGFRHIGYHFIIGRDGSIWTGRPLNWTGAHAGPYGNPMSIGVALWGDLRQEEPTKTALEALGVVWATCMDFFSMQPEVCLHRDFALRTECLSEVDRHVFYHHIIGAVESMSPADNDRRWHHGQCDVSAKGRVRDGAGWCQDGVQWLPAALASDLGYRSQWDPQRNLGVIYNEDRIFHSIPPMPSLAGRPQCFAVNSYIPCFLSEGNKLYVAARPLAHAVGAKVGWKDGTLILE